MDDLWKHCQPRVGAILEPNSPKSRITVTTPSHCKSSKITESMYAVLSNDFEGKL